MNGESTSSVPQRDVPETAKGDEMTWEEAERGLEASERALAGWIARGEPGDPLSARSYAGTLARLRHEARVLRCVERERAARVKAEGEVDELRRALAAMTAERDGLRRASADRAPPVVTRVNAVDRRDRRSRSPARVVTLLATAADVDPITRAAVTHLNDAERVAVATAVASALPEPITPWEELRRVEELLATASADARLDARLLGEHASGPAHIFEGFMLDNTNRTFEHRLARFLASTEREWRLRYKRTIAAHAARRSP